MTFLRAIAIWMLIIAAETVHGIFRTIFLVPILGDLPARQFSVFTGCILIFMVAYFLTSWMGAKSKKKLLAVGVLWVVLTLLFEVVLGRSVLDLSWSRITADYDLSRGGLLGFGLLFMAMTPILLARLRRIGPFV